MRVTVCQLRCGDEHREGDWEALAEHVRREGSDLVLLPEMPFMPWIFSQPDFTPKAWLEAERKHRRGMARLQDLAAPLVTGARPVSLEGKRLNCGFVWEPSGQLRDVHQKYYLPDEPGYWEASWYDRGNGEFRAAQVGPALAGFLMCTDLWFLEKARSYGRQGAHLLLVPRASSRANAPKWLIAGRTAAMVSGAWCLSSNRAGIEGPTSLGGQGWIMDPDGQVLGVTSEEDPFLTLEIDLTAAEAAKKDYPRNVPE